MQSGRLRPLSVGDILDVAIKLYRSRFLDLLRLAAVVVVPVQILALIIRLSTLPTATTGSAGNPFSSLTPGTVPANGQPVQLHALQLNSDFWTSTAGSLVASILVLTATQLVVASSFHLLSRSYLGQAVTWRASLGYAARRLHSVLWVFLLDYLIALISLVAIIVPGVYLWGSWLVSLPVLLEEDVRGRRALGRSRRLVRRRWWPTVGAYLLGLLLTSIVNVVLSGVILAVVLSGHSGTAGAEVLSAVTGTIGSVLVTPFTAGVVTVIYFDLRVRKEGLDLLLLAQEIGVEPGPRPAFLPPPPPPSGQQPPFWPPPPGWRPPTDPPTDPPADAPAWPPPPGWRPPTDPPTDPPAWPPPG